MTGAYGWTGNELLPCGDLVPAPELNARRRRVGGGQNGVALAAEFVGADQWAPDSLLARARAPTIRVMGDVDAGLVTDRAAEQLQGLQVALARKEESRPAVVPDRPRRLGAIAGFELGEVVVAEQELDALARPARGIAGKPRDAGEVGRLVERQHQPWLEHATLGACFRRRPAEERLQ